MRRNLLVTKLIKLLDATRLLQLHAYIHVTYIHVYIHMYVCTYCMHACMYMYVHTYCMHACVYSFSSAKLSFDAN